MEVVYNATTLVHSILTLLKLEFLKVIFFFFRKKHDDHLLLFYEELIQYYFKFTKYLKKLFKIDCRLKNADVICFMLIS